MNILVMTVVIVMIFLFNALTSFYHEYPSFLCSSCAVISPQMQFFWYGDWDVLCQIRPGWQPRAWGGWNQEDVGWSWRAESWAGKWVDQVYLCILCCTLSLSPSSYFKCFINMFGSLLPFFCVLKVFLSQKEFSYWGRWWIFIPSIVFLYHY